MIPWPVSFKYRLACRTRQAARNNERIGNRLQQQKEAVGQWNYRTCPTLKEALEGSDFVVISILPGTFDEMASDVHLPQRLGIYQSVGDTAGPGGMIRALRTIPMFVTIARAIRDYAPKAWVINYTNPMSLCVKTLYYIFPEIKAFACVHRVKMDLFQKYGCIAAAGDRHLAEFMPSGEYLRDPETVKSWKFGLTPVDWRKEDLRKRLERSERLVKGEETIELKPTDEEGVMLLKALCGLGRVVSNVNLPNTAGQIANLPKDAVVETNALFERDAIHPASAGSMPEAIYRLTLPHVQNHETILKAALTCDRGMVVKAFLNDPLVRGKGCSEEEVRALAEDMIANTMKYLPEGWKKEEARPAGISWS